MMGDFIPRMVHGSHGKRCEQVNAAKKFRFDELEKVAQFDQPVAIRYDDKQWKTLSRQFNGLPSGV